MAITNKVIDGAFDLTNALKNTGYKSAKQLEQEQTKQTLENRLSKISSSFGLSGSIKESTVTMDEVRRKIAQRQAKQQQEQFKKMQQLQSQAEKISKNTDLSGEISMTKPNIEAEYISPDFNSKQTIDTLSSREKEVNNFLGKDTPNYEDVIDKPLSSKDYSYVFEKDYAPIENYGNGFKASQSSTNLRSGNATNNTTLQSGNIPNNTQSGPLTANDFKNVTGNNDNAAYNFMRTKLARRFNETDSKIKAIQDNADLSEIDKTKQINDIYSVFGDNVKNMNDVKNSLLEQAKKGPQFSDYAFGYTPHAVGLGLLYGMGSMALGNNKGQKTNAELYSNPF